jgi:hypothetical protein
MRALKIILVAFLFIACVLVSTANMHSVQLVFPDVPIAGWPHFEPIQVPLFFVLLITLFAGVLLAALATLLEQVRLRTIARRARRERERAERAREEAERARDVAEGERASLIAQAEQARSELAAVRSMVDQAQKESTALRVERDALRAELDAARAQTSPGESASLPQGEETP